MSNYRPSTRASSTASPLTPLPANTPTPGPKNTKKGASRPKRTSVDFLQGQQVIAGKESTSYGSSTAVVPMAMKRVQHNNLENALEDIVGDAVPESEFTPL